MYKTHYVKPRPLSDLSLNERTACGRMEADVMYVSEKMRHVDCKECIKKVEQR